MPGDTLDLEDLLEVPDDPRFVAGIFNYCNRRCDRCAFADRCRLRADEQLDEALHPHDDWAERVHRSLVKTRAMLEAWSAREGIAFEVLPQRAEAAEVSGVEAVQELVAAARQDPLLKLAERYTFAAMKLAAAMQRDAAIETWPPEAREALETIRWYGIRVSSKIHRALTGAARHRDEHLEGDWRQSDWNGSAKVARLEIAESRAAWETILRVGRAPADSPLRPLIAHLDDIDAALASRFPEALAFVRPGFDEPERRAGGGCD